MFFVVFGILQADSDPALMAVFLAVGAAFLVWFFLYIRSRERAGKEPLLSTGLFKNRTSNLGLATQNIQWLLLMGTSFIVAVFLQTVRGYNAIETGVVFTAATVGVLVSSLAAERLAKRRPQKTLIMAGFVITHGRDRAPARLVGASSRAVAFAPGLLLIGLGLGVMLTPSVNVVQSSFPEALQGEISGLSRSISNLGSSFGTAIAGTILVSDLASGNTTYVLAMVVLGVLALVGLVAAMFLPATPPPAGRAPVGGWSPCDPPRWRPFVVDTSGSVTEAIYGLILATSVIAVSAEYDSSNAGLVAVTVLVTGVVFWLAHVYARVLAGSLTHHRMLSRSEVRSVFRHDWPLVEVTVPLVLILGLGVLGLVGDRRAILAATLAALVELAAVGAYSARLSGAGVPGTVASAIVAVSLGSAVVLLKALVH